MSTRVLARRYSLWTRTHRLPRAAGQRRGVPRESTESRERRMCEDRYRRRPPRLLFRALYKCTFAYLLYF